MTVRLLLFASCAEIIGQKELDFTLADGSTVQSLLSRLTTEYPGLEALRDVLSVAVNTEYVKQTHPLEQGDEVALIPPVSGGSCSR